jgi:hypothetical protein
VLKTSVLFCSGDFAWCRLEWRRTVIWESMGAFELQRLMD